jgi:hypothetical protein
MIIKQKFPLKSVCIEHFSKTACQLRAKALLPLLILLHGLCAAAAKLAGRHLSQKLFYRRGQRENARI